VTGGVAVLFALLAVVGPVVLYVLVRSEHDNRERMDRKRAERAARRDRDADADSPNRGRDGRRRNT
jgi:hypothetical protein